MQVFQAAVGVFRAFRPSTYACCNSNHLDGVLPVLQFFTPSYGPSLSPGIKAHGQLARDQFGQMTCEATELCLAIDPKILPIYLCISHAFQHHIPYSIFTCISICAPTHTYMLKNKKTWCMVRTACTFVPRRRWLTVLVGPGSSEHLRAVGTAHDIFVWLVRFCLMRFYHEFTFTSMCSNSSWPRAVQSMPFWYNCDFDSRQTHEPCAALKSLSFHLKPAMWSGCALWVRRSRSD